MSIASILAKCGMTADDVARISAKNQPKKTQAQIARENERKYEGVKNAFDDYVDKTYGVDKYVRIASGNDNGGCTSRRGTYCKLKTGDGRCRTKEEVLERKKMDAIRNNEGRFKPI